MNTEIMESPQQTGVGRNLTLDAASMSSMVALAKIMSTGKATIPREYQGSEGDCLAVVMQAVQWGMNPFAVAQKTHFISGKIGYEAQLVNSVITALAPTKDRLHFEWFGDWTKVIGKFEVKKNQEGKEYRQPGWKLADEEGLGVRCWATMKGEDEPRMLELLLAQARTRNSTLWADDPRQQLAYLAVKRWSRLYCPDVIMGVYTPDELEESKPERDITPTPQGSGLDRLLGAGKKNQPSADVSVELEGFLSVIPSINGMPDWQQKYSAAWTWAEKQSVEIQNEIKKAYLGHRVKLMKEDVDSAINAGDFELAIDLIGSLPEKCQQEMREKVEAAKQENIPV